MVQGFIRNSGGEEELSGGFNQNCYIVWSLRWKVKFLLRFILSHRLVQFILEFCGVAAFADVINVEVSHFDTDEGLDLLLCR